MCTSHNVSLFAIFLLNIILTGGNLTKLLQKQFCAVFRHCVVLVCSQLEIGSDF